MKTETHETDGETDGGSDRGPRAASLSLSELEGRQRVNQILIDSMRTLGVRHIDECSSAGFTPLTYACAMRDNVSAIALIDHGARVDVTSSMHRTPLFHLCTAGGGPHLATRLIEAGADVNVRDRDGNTPLHAACMSGSALLVETLLSSGRASPTTQNAQGETPLHLATHPSMVNVLYSFGAYLNAADAAGNTPVHAAILSNRVPVLRALVDLQARMDVRNAAGASPLDLLLRDRDRAGASASASASAGSSSSSRSGSSSGSSSSSRSGSSSGSSSSVSSSSGSSSSSCSSDPSPPLFRSRPLVTLLWKGGVPYTQPGRFLPAAPPSSSLAALAAARTAARPSSQLAEDGARSKRQRADAADDFTACQTLDNHDISLGDNDDEFNAA